MQAELAPVISSRNMLRPEDATRLARPSRHDDHDRPWTAGGNNRVFMATDQGDPTQTLDDSPPRTEEGSAAQAMKSGPTLLSPEDTTELFRSKVADARLDTEHALAGSEAVSDAVKPKLTLDMGHSNIARLPETVVDLIKNEVERLSLSHNQIWHIPLRFSECAHLRYLNIRSNVFREIPRGVYKLPLLEILDISRNKVRKISRDIRNLTSLRVFSVVHNRIDDLPTELCEMTKLQILKIAENPLRFKLKKVVEAKEAEVAYSEMTDNERETAVTLEIKRYLRELYPAIPPLDVEASLDADEGPMETPKPPLKRVLSSRFPVIPSTSNTDLTVDGGSKSSPSQGAHPAPPIPSRSHYRMTSGQSVALRRPGITPLMNANERNRSNSESVLQASAAARQKRMGMLRKERTELDSIEEMRVNRNSHLRGFSHGSVLKRNGNLSSPGGAGSSSPSSPRDARRARQAFVKRLSSLPEQKVDNEWHNPIIDGAKGILYALYQVHPQISGLIAAVKGKEVRRSTLEFTFFNASTHVDRLNEALEQADLVDTEDPEAVEKAEDTVQRDCATCIMAYAHVTAQLQDNVGKIVAGTDARYVRTLMLLLYGSMIEIRNAISSFGFEVQIQPRGHWRRMSSGNTKPIQTIPEECSTPQQPLRAVTPTRDRGLYLRQGARLRSDTTIQHPSTVPHTAPLPTPLQLTGTTMNGGTYSHTVTSFSSVSTLSSSASIGERSRSNSRTTGNLSMTTTATSTVAASTTSSSFSSIASTPRSGEDFNLPVANTYTVQINPTTGLTDAQEEAVFEQIFRSLARAYDAALQTIPIARTQFIRCREAAEEMRQPKAVHDLWSTLIYRCRLCIDVSEALQTRLVNMRLKDPGQNVVASGGRNDPSFWLLCKHFLGSLVDLLTELREAKGLRILPSEMITMFRPIQKASREAGRLIENSPWRMLTDGAASHSGSASFNSVVHPPAAANVHGHAYGSGGNGNLQSTITSYLSAVSQHHLHQSQSPFPPPLAPVPPVPGPSASSTQANGIPTALNGTSPVSVPLPATPLSAALGPAAQATMPTVPNTPASAYGDQFFKGDVFQRADSLLSMPQAGSVNFLNRR